MLGNLVNQDKSTIFERMRNFNEGFDIIQDFGITILMILIALVQVVGQPIALLLASYVEHNRVRESVEGFLSSEGSVAVNAAAFFVFVLVVIPIAIVFTKLMDGTLELEKEEEEKKVSGFTLVKFSRWFRFFVGLWSEFSYRDKNGDEHVVWDALEINMKRPTVFTGLMIFEILVISSATILSYFDAINKIEGLSELVSGMVWYDGLVYLFTKSELFVFMDVFGATILTLVIAIGMRNLSHNIAMSVAAKIIERRERVQERLQEIESQRQKAIEAERSKNIMSILKSSVMKGTFWLNLQTLEKIKIEEDEVDVTEGAFRFYDSVEKEWTKPYQTKTQLKKAILKRLELR